MNRLNLVISSAIVALTLLPSSVLAQEKTLKQQMDLGHSHPATIQTQKARKTLTVLTTM
jgi:hypothetical protein